MALCGATVYQVITGIILGPSVLGTNIHGFSQTVFPPKSLPSLSLVANIGLVLYLFCVGIELVGQVAPSSLPCSVIEAAGLYGGGDIFSGL